METFRLKIFPFLWIVFTIFYTYLWLGDFIEYRININQYTVIQYARITNTHMTGRFGPGEIEFTYKYNNEWHYARCTKYWGDRVNRHINVAINDNGDIIRTDFPFENSIFLEFVFVMISIFELWLVYMLFLNNLRKYRG